jgi:hypothetical protein
MNWKRGVVRVYVVIWVAWALLLLALKNWRLWLGAGLALPAVLLGVLLWVWSGFQGSSAKKP